MSDSEARWPRYVRLLREGGVSEPEIAVILARMAREDADLKAGRCPKCGAPSKEYIDGSPRGSETEWGPGVWVQYRCSTQNPPGQVSPPGTCLFMLDRWEARGAN